MIYGWPVFSRYWNERSDVTESCREVKHACRKETMLMALEQREQSQLPRIPTGIFNNEAQFFIAWAIKRLEFSGSQGRLKTRIGRPINRSHKGGIL